MRFIFNCRPSGPWTTPRVRLALGPTGYFENPLTISKANELVSKREFVFGRDGALNFAVQDYPALKKAFDLIQVRDQHSLSLKAAN